MTEPYLSVVVPVFNEEEVLPELYRRLKIVLDEIGKDHELLFVNDGSTDRTLTILDHLREEDPCVKYLNFSRNFGHQIAVTAGIDFARGENIVIIDADLQDPPELIPEILQKRSEGYDVVYAVRTRRLGEPAMRLFLIRCFYRVLDNITGIHIPMNSGDFRLLSRRVANGLRKVREHNRYVRGLTSWIGYPSIGVPYERSARFAGKTKYPFFKLLKFAFDAISSFSYIPLRLAAYVGFFAAALSLAFALYVFILRLAGSQALEQLRGWTSTIIAVSFLGSLQLICLGILGEYIARIYDEAKNRPIYFIMDSKGIDPEQTRP
jgi:polyisoprenyl-phosphate glycosyltransferase